MKSEKVLREKVCKLNIDLQRYGLVAWTAGNVSELMDDRKRFMIKPSGVSYEDLKPSQMIICDLDGEVLEGGLSPSSDTKTHAYIYRHMKDIGGVVHTHSSYAAAWSAIHSSIPCALTAMADEFGGEIPLGPFALIGNDAIGKGVVETLTGHRSSAILMKNHGVFSIGKDATDAVKSAVMCEDVAKTTWIAKTLGSLQLIDQASVDSLYERYQNIYGQRDK
ncbi:MAG: L-ribulose-5-phosphate 4-epimerase [Candidatus Planktophila sp.]|tara:strand:- start:16349 stop:17011 length:663 start_codon:yes stop_codon:yes gene_type:complete